MATIIYPPCKNDDIRKTPVDFTNPLDNFNLNVSKITAKSITAKSGKRICSTCVLERRIIAKGNRFDDIDGEW